MKCLTHLYHSFSELFVKGESKAAKKLHGPAREDIFLAFSGSFTVSEAMEK